MLEQFDPFPSKTNGFWDMHTSPTSHTSDAGNVNIIKEGEFPRQPNKT